MFLQEKQLWEDALWSDNDNDNDNDLNDVADSNHVKGNFNI
jgi:hypothetical protein